MTASLNRPTQAASVWSDRRGDTVVTFIGRTDSTPTRLDLAGASDGPAGTPAWLEQVHGAGVRTARPGWSGKGDALVTPAGTTAECLALSPVVVTADCVPILVATPQRLAAIHAGWRGLVAGVIPATLARIASEGGLEDAAVWVGPAAGACCYEVGREVADAVVAESQASVVRETASRPHLDLAAAAQHQVAAAGVRMIRVANRCTCCDEGWWSYRRDGVSAGRNVAVIRRDPAARAAGVSPDVG